MAFEIDTLTDGTPTYEQRTELDGEEYRLTFQWNGRVDRWAFGLIGLDGTPILAGQMVHLNVPLNRRAVGGPPGVFIAVVEDGSTDPPGLLELGGRVKLIYVEASEVEALTAEE